MARTTASLNVLLALRTEGIGKALQVANKQLNAFARQAKAAGEQMTMSFTLPAAVIGGSAIKAFADMEKLEKSLTAVSGSSDEARAQLERLRVLALEPGLDLEQAAKATIRLQSVGYAASEAERTILQMSKAVTLAGGTADDLDEVVRQMTQMIGRGTILREDWNVIAERVPAINIALQDAFGTTNIEAIRETGISVKDFNDAIVQAISENEKFQAVQGGTANAITNFQSALRQALATVGKAINENANITTILDKLTGVVERLANGFANLSPRMQSIIIYSAAFVAALGPLLFALGSFATILPTITSGVTLLVKGFGGTIGVVKVLGGTMGILLQKIPLVAAAFAKLSPIFAAIKTQAAAAWLAMSGPIGWITAAVVALGAAVVIMYQKWDKFRGIVKGTAAALKEAADGFERSLVQGGSRADAAIMGLNPDRYESKGKSLGEAFAKGYNEGVADLNKELPTTTDAQTRKFGYDLARGVTGRDMPFPFRRPTAQPEQPSARPRRTFGLNLSEEEQARADFLANKRRTDAMATPELPSLAGQIQETGALALATQGAALSATSMADAFRDSTDVLGNIMEPLQKTSEQFNWLEESLSSLNSIYEMSLDSLVKLSEQGELTLASFAKAVAGHVRQIIGLLIKEGVAAAVSKSLNNPAITLNPALIPVIALGAGKLAQTAFNSILSAIKVPALATGGLAYGPTMALVGDNPGARSNPEVIAPLSKLQGMLEQSGGMAIGEFRLRGEDLLLSVTRTQNRQNRYK